MKIAIGCDPNAQQAKEELIKFMEDKGYGEIHPFFHAHGGRQSRVRLPCSPMIFVVH